MFTIKFYSADGYRQVIKQAESFTILRIKDGTAEITLHQKNQGDDCRIDIADDVERHTAGCPARYGKAIIENAAGRTTEIIVLRPLTGQLVTAERQ
jgi:hypothetical protein